jgi:hypothetical protein
MRQGGVWIALIVFAAQWAFSQPVITKEPESRAVPEGARVNFAVQAVGSGLRYQWQFNGQDIPNASGRTLAFTATQSRAGVYSVVVRDSSDTAQRSSPAKLEVQKRPRVVAQPRAQVVGEGQTAVFEVRMNESAPYQAVQWYHHSPEEPYHPIPPAAARGVNTFRLEVFDTHNNGTYNGRFTLCVTNTVGGTKSRAATLRVVGTPQIISFARDRAVRRGGTATFAVRVAPDAAPQKLYQWYRNNQPIGGATRPRLTLFNVQPEHAGYYHCVVSSIGGRSTSPASQLTVH